MSARRFVNAESPGRLNRTTTRSSQTGVENRQDTPLSRINITHWKNSHDKPTSSAGLRVLSCADRSSLKHWNYALKKLLHDTANEDRGSFNVRSRLHACQSTPSTTAHDEDHAACFRAYRRAGAAQALKV